MRFLKTLFGRRSPVLVGSRDGLIVPSAAEKQWSLRDLARFEKEFGLKHIGNNWSCEPTGIMNEPEMAHPDAVLPLLAEIYKRHPCDTIAVPMGEPVVFACNSTPPYVLQTMLTAKEGGAVVADIIKAGGLALRAIEGLILVRTTVDEGISPLLKYVLAV